MYKQEKINQILALMRGEITPAMLSKNRMIKIGYGELGENIYLLDGKEVSKEVFDASSRHNEQGFKGMEFVIVYGDDSGEEYYAG